MAINVALEVLSDPDFLINLTVSRVASAGSYVDGRYIDPATTNIIVPASVQPASAEDFKNMPEGERFGGSQVILSLTELIGSKDLKKADRVINYLGVDWKIVTVDSWAHHGYYRAIMVKIDGN